MTKKSPHVKNQTKLFNFEREKMTEKISRNAWPY